MREVSFTHIAVACDEMLYSWVIIAQCTANTHCFTVCVGIVNIIHISVMVCTFTDKFFEHVCFIFQHEKLVFGVLELSVYLSSTWHVPGWGPRLAVPAVACSGWGACIMVIRSCADHFCIEVKYVWGLCLLYVI